jgi:tetratricopeptide (TPR) repeat protein
VAPSLLGASAPDAPRERLGRARADADMVLRLEGVRLRLSEGASVRGRVSVAADELYAGAFNRYGINLTTLGAPDAAALVRNSGIRDTLLVFLHDWLYWAPEANRAKLRAVVDAADDDPWRRAFRDARAANDLAKLAELSRAPGATDQPPVLISGLGGALLVDGHADEAWAFLREAQRRHPGDFWINYLLGVYLEQAHPQEAVGYFRAAVAVRPDSNQAYAFLSRVLREAGSPDEAVAALQKAVALHPSHGAVFDLLKVLAPAGRMEEGRATWERLLETNPPDHDTWNGYAQLCLHLGNEPAYRRARRRLLDRFGNVPGEWMVAERTALACLSHRHRSRPRRLRMGEGARVRQVAQARQPVRHLRGRYVGVPDGPGPRGAPAAPRGGGEDRRPGRPPARAGDGAVRIRLQGRGAPDPGGGVAGPQLAAVRGRPAVGEPRAPARSRGTDPAGRPAAARDGRGVARRRRRRRRAACAGGNVSRQGPLPFRRPPDGRCVRRRPAAGG